MYGFKVIPTKIPVGWIYLFVYLFTVDAEKLFLKFMWKCKELRLVRQFCKRNTELEDFIWF